MRRAATEVKVLPLVIVDHTSADPAECSITLKYLQIAIGAPCLAPMRQLGQSCLVLSQHGIPRYFSFSNKLYFCPRIIKQWFRPEEYLRGQGNLGFTMDPRACILPIRILSLLFSITFPTGTQIFSAALNRHFESARL